MRKLNNWVTPVFDNEVDAMIPELWAAEGLLQLVDNLVATKLVHTDFSKDIAKQGDVVNAHRPQAMKAKRKGVNDDIVSSDANADSVQVPLDQYLYESFIIKDTEAAMAFQDLVQMFLTPAITSLAEAADKIVLGLIYNFINNSVGQLNGLTTADFKTYLLRLRKNMNDSKVPVADRRLILSTVSEMLALGLEEFTAADKVGDKGTSMRNASLGKVFGFDTFMDQNTPTVEASSIDSVVRNTTAAYPVGAVAITCASFGTAPVAGSYITFAGSAIPYKIASATATVVTLEKGLQHAIASGAAATYVKPCLVNAVGGYPVKYDKYITIDGFTAGKVPQIGQLVDFAGLVYSIIDVDGSSILLNKPLQVAIADNQAVLLGPAGSYSFAFNRNALAFVNRPLPMVRPGIGANSFVISAEGISLRVVMSYDDTKDGTRVTVAMLCGVAVLDEKLGHVLCN